jgi:hypothetical protein
VGSALGPEPEPEHLADVAPGGEGADNGAGLPSDDDEQRDGARGSEPSDSEDERAKELDRKIAALEALEEATEETTKETMGEATEEATEEESDYGAAAGRVQLPLRLAAAQPMGRTPGRGRPMVVDSDASSDDEEPRANPEKLASLIQRRLLRNQAAAADFYDEPPDIEEDADDKYVVVNPATVQKSIEITSAAVGSLESGATVEGIDMQVSADGVIRIYCAVPYEPYFGWVSVQSKEGTVFLKQLDRAPMIEHRSIDTAAIQLEGTLEIHLVPRAGEPEDTDTKKEKWSACQLRLRGRALQVRLVQRASLVNKLRGGSSKRDGSQSEFEFGVPLRDAVVTPGPAPREFALAAVGEDGAARQYEFRAKDMLGAIEWQRALVEATLKAEMLPLDLSLASVAAAGGTRQDYLRARKTHRQLQNAFEAWQWCYTTKKELARRLARWRRRGPQRAAYRVFRAWRRCQRIVERRGDLGWWRCHARKAFRGWNAWHWEARNSKAARVHEDYEATLLFLELTFTPWRQWVQARGRYLRRYRWHMERCRGRQLSWTFVAWRHKYSTFVRHYATLVKAARMRERQAVLCALRRWAAWFDARAEVSFIVRRHWARHGGLPCRSRGTVARVLEAWSGWLERLSAIVSQHQAGRAFDGWASLSMATRGARLERQYNTSVLAKVLAGWMKWHRTTQRSNRVVNIRRARIGRQHVAACFDAWSMQRGDATYSRRRVHTFQRNRSRTVKLKVFHAWEHVCTDAIASVWEVTRMVQDKKKIKLAQLFYQWKLVIERRGMTIGEGNRYKVVKKAAVQRGIALDSAFVGFLKYGETLSAIEIRKLDDDDDEIRVKVIGGWVSVSHDGKDFLEREFGGSVAGAAPAANHGEVSNTDDAEESTKGVIAEDEGLLHLLPAHLQQEAVAAGKNNTKAAKVQAKLQRTAGKDEEKAVKAAEKDSAKRLKKEAKAKKYETSGGVTLSPFAVQDNAADPSPPADKGKGKAGPPSRDSESERIGNGKGKTDSPAPPSEDERGIGPLPDDSDTFEDAGLRGEYKVVAKATVRESITLESEKLGVLRVGQVIDVLQSCTTDTGQVRLRFNQGWTSLESKDGSVLLAQNQKVQKLPTSARKARRGSIEGGGAIMAASSLAGQQLFDVQQNHVKRAPKKVVLSVTDMGITLFENSSNMKPVETTLFDSIQSWNYDAGHFRMVVNPDSREINFQTGDGARIQMLVVQQVAKLRDAKEKINAEERAAAKREEAVEGGMGAQRDVAKQAGSREVHTEYGNSSLGLFNRGVQDTPMEQADKANVDSVGKGKGKDTTGGKGKMEGIDKGKGKVEVKGKGKDTAGNKGKGKDIAGGKGKVDGNINTDGQHKGKNTSAAPPQFQHSSVSGHLDMSPQTGAKPPSLAQPRPLGLSAWTGSPPRQKQASARHPGEVYEVLRKAMIRSSFDRASEEVGVLLPGECINVFETRMNYDGQTRVRSAMGLKVISCRPLCFIRDDPYKAERPAAK